MNMLASGWRETEGLLSVEPASPHQLLYEVSRETYAVDNSALTGRGRRPAHIAGPAVLTQPGTPLAPSGCPGAAAGLIAMKVTVPPHCAALDMGKGSGATRWVLLLASGSRRPRTVQVEWRGGDRSRWTNLFDLWQPVTPGGGLDHRQGRCLCR